MEEHRTWEEQNTRKNHILAGADTFGWDTSFTTTYEVVNREIRENSTYPATFSNETEAHALLDYLSGANAESYYQLLKPTLQKGSSVKLTGNWGQWQLELRGNGNSIYMRLPVTSGKITLDETEASLVGRNKSSEKVADTDRRRAIPGSNNRSLFSRVGPGKYSGSAGGGNL